MWHAHSLTGENVSMEMMHETNAVFSSILGIASSGFRTNEWKWLFSNIVVENYGEFNSNEQIILTEETHTKQRSVYVSAVHKTPIGILKGKKREKIWARQTLAKSHPTFMITWEHCALSSRFVRNSDSVDVNAAKPHVQTRSLLFTYCAKEFLPTESRCVLTVLCCSFLFICLRCVLFEPFVLLMQKRAKKEAIPKKTIAAKILSFAFELKIKWRLNVHWKWFNSLEKSVLAFLNNFASGLKRYVTVFVEI